MSPLLGCCGLSPVLVGILRFSDQVSKSKLGCKQKRVKGTAADGKAEPRCLQSAVKFSDIIIIVIIVVVIIIVVVVIIVISVIQLETEENYRLLKKANVTYCLYSAAKNSAMLSLPSSLPSP